MVSDVRGIGSRTIPVLENAVHQVGNTCLELEASWLGWSRAVKPGRYGFHSKSVSDIQTQGQGHKLWKEQCCKVRQDKL